MPTHAAKMLQFHGRVPTCEMGTEPAAGRGAHTQRGLAQTQLLLQGVLHGLWEGQRSYPPKPSPN